MRLAVLDNAIRGGASLAACGSHAAALPALVRQLDAQDDCCVPNRESTLQIPSSANRTNAISCGKILPADAIKNAHPGVFGIFENRGECVMQKRA